MNNHWTLVFRAEGDGPPVEIRVRKLLKAALRCYRLRCVQVRGDDEFPRTIREGSRSGNEENRTDAGKPEPYKTLGDGHVF